MSLYYYEIAQLKPSRPVDKARVRCIFVPVFFFGFFFCFFVGGGVGGVHRFPPRCHWRCLNYIGLALPPCLYPRYARNVNGKSRCYLCKPSLWKTCIGSWVIGHIIFHNHHIWRMKMVIKMKYPIRLYQIKVCFSVHSMLFLIFAHIKLFVSTRWRYYLSVLLPFSFITAEFFGNSVKEMLLLCSHPHMSFSHYWCNMGSITHGWWRWHIRLLLYQVFISVVVNSIAWLMEHKYTPAAIIGLMRFR